MKLAVIGGSREADQLIKAVKQLGVEIDAAAHTIVIAPHPLDTDLIECALLSASGKSYVLLQRPEWTASRDDNWLNAGSVAIAAELLASLKVKHALLVVGNARLAPFYRLPEIELFVRSRNPPHPPIPPFGQICPLRGPFDVETEITAMTENRIEALVVHNAGGQGGWPKMQAARHLGLPVILIDRPEPPKITTFTSVEATLKWVAASLGLDLLG